MLQTNYLCVLAMVSLISLPLYSSIAFPMTEKSAERREKEMVAITPEPRETTVMHLFAMKNGSNSTQKAKKNVILNKRKRQDEEPPPEGEEGGAEGGEGGETPAPAEGGGDAPPGGGDGGATPAGDSGGGGGANGTDSGESTPYGGTHPQFIRDGLGNWIYNLWGATYGKIGQDTRFAADQTMQRIKVESNPAQNYYPDANGNLSTVCMDASTIYNVPIVKEWLIRKVYRQPIKSRPIWKELRMHIYKIGKSEECHNTTQFPQWRDYQECAIRRNMRLESLIPMYPMHQMGSGF